MVFIFCLLVAMLVFQKWLMFTIDRLQQIYVKCSHKTSANVHKSQVHFHIVGNIGQEHREQWSIHYARWIYIRGSIPPSVDPSVRRSVCKSFVSDLASYGLDFSDALILFFSPYCNCFQLWFLDASLHLYNTTGYVCQSVGLSVCRSVGLSIGR